MPSWKSYFEPLPLPRWRAVVTLLFAGFAFLSFAGLLEYASGSPETHGRAGASYWAAFFALHFVLFAGAALLGGFPRLARWPFKLVWLLCAALLAAAAFSIRLRVAIASGYLFPWQAYLPAVAVLLIGIGWRPLSGGQSE